MKNKLNLQKGTEVLEYQGAKNIKQMESVVRTIAEKYSNLAISDDNIKEAKEVLKEIKPYHIQLKKYRASVNKELKKAKKQKINEIDEIVDILGDVRSPLENNIEKYKEEKRQKKIEEKKKIFEPQLEQLNEDLKEIAESLPSFEYEPIALDWEKFAYRSNETVTDEINSKSKEVRQDIENKLARVELVEMQAKIFKSEYDLAGDVNWGQMDDKIYRDDWKKILEEIAATQQEQELLAVKREKERKERELEKARIQKEKEEKEKQYKKEYKLAEEYSEIIEEKLDRESAEKATDDIECLEVEEKPTQAPQEPQKEKKATGRDVKLLLPNLSKEKAIELRNFLNKSEIKYKIEEV